MHSPRLIVPPNGRDMPSGSFVLVPFVPIQCQSREIQIELGGAFFGLDAVLVVDALGIRPQSLHLFGMDALKTHQFRFELIAERAGHG